VTASAVSPGTGSPAGAATPVFRATGVGKSYPGVVALQGLDLEGYPGEVLAVCGANGAGKSTFARLLAGQEAPTTGTITIAGHDGPVTSPADAERAGILLMHQEPLIIDDFTIGQNVWLFTLRSGRDVKAWHPGRRTDDEETREVLRGVGLGNLSPNRSAAELGPGQRQMLALSRAAVTPHKIMILDETTASTTEEHFKDVEQLVVDERAAGTSIVFVSHRLPEVFALADRIAVLRNGTLVDVLRTSETTPEHVTTLMVGQALRAVDRPQAFTETTERPPVMSVRNLSGGAARDVSLDVRAGEVVGLYGLVGSGRSSVARSITGQHRPAGGTVLLDGEPIRYRSPGAALRAGVAYLTEDRRLEGFVPDFDNGENLSLAVLNTELSRFGVVRTRQERTVVRSLIERFQVKGGQHTFTSTLSGGNQQKVCVAKWLQADPKFLVLDEPTKGVDVGARANIYRIIHEAAHEGRALLVVSSEAEELLQLCHRIVVLRDGAVVGEFDPAQSTTEDLIRAALGGPAA
jgi:ribose transport system ATP-binding protein